MLLSFYSSLRLKKDDKISSLNSYMYPDESNQTWTEECPQFDDLDLEEQLAVQWLEVYNIEASKMMNKATISQWNYGANITDYNKEVMVI